MFDNGVPVRWEWTLVSFLLRELVHCDLLLSDKQLPLPSLMERERFTDQTLLDSKRCLIEEDTRNSLCQSVFPGFTDRNESYIWRCSCKSILICLCRSLLTCIVVASPSSTDFCADTVFEFVKDKYELYKKFAKQSHDCFHDYIILYRWNKMSFGLVKVCLFCFKSVWRIALNNALIYNWCPVIIL